MVQLLEGNSVRNNHNPIHGSCAIYFPHTVIELFNFHLDGVNLRLAIKLCLHGRLGEALYVVAVVCSSWSAVNKGTSQRDVLTPLGDPSITGVRAGNQMVSRLESLGFASTRACFKERDNILYELHSITFLC